MRRPSRQGLVVVCTCSTNPPLAAPPTLKSREKSRHSVNHEFADVQFILYRVPPRISHLAITIAVIIGILALNPRDGYAQYPDSILSEYFSKLRVGERPSMPLDALTKESHETIFSLLQPYLRDSVNTIRSKASEIVHHLGLRASQNEIRRHAVDILVRSYGVDDAETSGLILAFLTRYAREDFSMAARDSIRSIVRKESVYLTRILKLAGFLDLRDLKDEIRPWTQPGNPPQIRWTAFLSLARMGDPHALTAIHDLVKKLPLNDDIVYGVYPGLVYTRQPTLYTYMIESLQSKEEACMSADAEREVPVPCGYRIMEQLSPVIEGFPFALTPGGDLDVPNYPQALEEVRAWFKTNKTYTILNDKH